MTALDVSKKAMRLIGATGSGETPSTDEQADILDALNALLNSWSTEQLAMFAWKSQAFSLIAGQQTYTIGAGGSFNTARPLKIADARIQCAGAPLGAPLKIATRQEWMSIIERTIQGQLQQIAYCDYAYPVANLSLWPVPANTNVAIVELYMQQPFTTFVTVNDTFDMPPGYYRAIAYNLAVDIAPEFGKAIPQEVALVATQSKNDLITLNLSNVNAVNASQAAAPAQMQQQQAA